MSTTTPNMGLIKPALTDTADINDINANMDNLDAHSHLGRGCGRLTLASGTPVTTADVTAASYLYFTPYLGNRLALYDPAISSWVERRFDELTLPLASFAASTNFDVFIYNNAGTLALAAVAWSSGTARQTGLSLLDGIYVKSDNAAYRYLGTIRTTGTAGQCEDSTSRRFVWNYYNRKKRILRAVDSTSSWTYTTNAYRPANNNTADGVGRFSFVIGVSEDLVLAVHLAAAYNDTSTVTTYPGIALDSTTASNVSLQNAYVFTSMMRSHLMGHYSGNVAAGYHYLQKTERSTATGTTTWYGNSAGQKGLLGEIWA